jgi:hypothetical protein
MMASPTSSCSARTAAAKQSAWPIALIPDTTDRRGILVDEVGASDVAGNLLATAGSVNAFNAARPAREDLTFRDLTDHPRLKNGRVMR